MKRLFALLAAAVCLSAGARELNLLSVGNSFSWSVDPFLREIVKADGEDTLVYEHASLGGCPFKGHWDLVEKSEKDPNFKPYGKEPDTFTLKEKLQSRKWDIITIQQASHDSWQSQTFEPYAANLLAYIKKYAPQAEVVIQQTWAYRFDDPRLAKWGIDQQTMYDKLTQNYLDLGKELNLRIIPAGLAVQTARETQADKYVPYDKNILKNLKYPEDLPSEKGSFVRGLAWGKNKDGQYEIKQDSYHLNPRGCYLQACLWYGLLFDKDPTDIQFIPKELSKDDAKFLQETAKKVLGEFKQPCASADRK